ncbi:MAG: F0F1 ATP synthase subunit B [Clostridia bacterium]|nr:F0F1 ATP synthase subunit B [Clostridia bacterium]
MQNLEVISVNLWQILISLCNLLIIFLILKKFLYAPVKKMLAARQAEIDSDYAAADEARRAAESDRAAYAEKLSAAQAEADEMRKRAVADAEHRSDKILAEAKEKADSMVRAAENEIALERQKATDDIKKEIAEVSTQIAGKLLEREIDENDHRELIDSFIDKIGERS